MPRKTKTNLVTAPVTRKKTTKKVYLIEKTMNNKVIGVFSTKAKMVKAYKEVNLNPDKFEMREREVDKQTADFIKC